MKLLQRTRSITMDNGEPIKINNNIIYHLTYIITCIFYRLKSYLETAPTIEIPKCLKKNHPD